jgi:hypothetical protein
LFKSEEDTTPSGIIKVGDTDFQPAMHANRISEVVMVPEELYYGLVWHKRRNDATESMPWRTDMDLQVGDIVWHDYMNSLNCPVIDVEDSDEQYKLLNYYDLYVAKRKIPYVAKRKIPYMNFTEEVMFYGEERKLVVYDGMGPFQYANENGEMFAIIPLNGYVLCEEVKETRSSELDVLDPHVDKKYGKVAFLGKKNYGYRRERIKDAPIEKDFDGEMDLVPGDVIVKKRPEIHIMLEDPLHARFNGDTLYFVIQRKDIYAKVSDTNNS